MLLLMFFILIGLIKATVFCVVLVSVIGIIIIVVVLVGGIVDSIMVKVSSITIISSVVAIIGFTFHAVMDIRISIVIFVVLSTGKIVATINGLLGIFGYYFCIQFSIMRMIPCM